MVAEIRKIGGRLVLYTDEVEIYKYLNRKLSPSHKIPYIQNGKAVGFDFYYNLKLSRTIRQVAKGQLLLPL